MNIILDLSNCISYLLSTFNILFHFQTACNKIAKYVF